MRRHSRDRVDSNLARRPRDQPVDDDLPGDRPQQPSGRAARTRRHGQGERRDQHPSEPAPAGDQPAPSSAAPNVPDVPKHIPDSSRARMPAPWPARGPVRPRPADSVPVPSRVDLIATLAGGICLLLVRYAAPWIVVV